MKNNTVYKYNQSIFLLLLIILFIIFIYSKSYSKKEKLVNVASESDKLRAQKYALQKMCEKEGNVWKQFEDEFMYDCKYSKDGCLKESVYPTPDTEDAVPKYYEWRDKNHKDYREVVRLESSSNLLSTSVGASAKTTSQIGEEEGMCIMGSEAYRKWCEDESLRYDPNDGMCYTTQPYCLPKLLAFCNNDCFEPPGSWILSKVFGTTLGRSLGLLAGDSLTMLACGAGTLQPEPTVERQTVEKVSE